MKRIRLKSFIRFLKIPWKQKRSYMRLLKNEMMLIKYQLALMIKCQLMDLIQKAEKNKDLIQKAGKDKDLIQKDGKSKDRIPKVGKNKESTLKRRATVRMPTQPIHVINVI